MIKQWSHWNMHLERNHLSLIVGNNKDSLPIRAQAKYSFDALSDWSSLSITMPRSLRSFNILLTWICEKLIFSFSML